MHTLRGLAFGLAVVVLFSLFAGEAIRNTLSWWGFAVWDAALAVLLVAAGASLWRKSRGGHGHTSPLPLRNVLRDRRRLVAPPVWLAAFLILALASLAWSAYRVATLLAILVLAVTTMAAVVLRAWIGWPALVRALAVALHAILALSLVFELVVDLVIRRPVLPVFPIDVVPGEPVPQAYYWSRALLLEGGRIQGILGNANLLGFVALLALIVTGCLLAAGRIPPAPGWAGVVLAVAMLALTRSSTVLVAAAACAVVLVLMLLWHRGERSDPRRRVAFWFLTGLLGAATVAALAAGRALLPLLGKSDDLTGRLDIWAAVGGLIAQRPILGWGWISYWIPGVAPYDDLAVRRGVEYLQAHNAFLDVTVQLGLVGLAVFAALLVTTALGVARHGVPADDRSWLLARVLPSLLLAALLTQGLAESRLLVEGNWALLCLIALSASGTSAARADRNKAAVS